jgi:hypothetical protein
MRATRLKARKCATSSRDPANINVIRVADVGQLDERKRLLQLAFCVIAEAQSEGRPGSPRANRTHRRDTMIF